MVRINSLGEQIAANHSPAFSMRESAGAHTLSELYLESNMKTRDSVFYYYLESTSFE